MFVVAAATDVRKKGRMSVFIVDFHRSRFDDFFNFTTSGYNCTQPTVSCGHVADNIDVRSFVSQWDM